MATASGVLTRLPHPSAGGVRHTIRAAAGEVFALRWRPSLDLAVVAASWALVVASLSAATYIATAANGIQYFLFYAVLGATGFGFALPVGWMVYVRRRPLADLGLTTRRWRWSLSLQLAFAAVQYQQTLAHATLPPLAQLLPIISLVLAIGLFEAVFWRGWVHARLEEAFGFLPALAIGSALYAAYHIGYGMSLSEMGFLFGIGAMYAVAFRLTGSVLVLWPFFQPMGQLFWMTRDGLPLPLEATLGFIDVLALMATIIWWVRRRRRRTPGPGAPAVPVAA